MIHDRSEIKWTAMMMPEHLHRVKQWKQELHLEVPSDLSIWELDELQEVINRAICHNKKIVLSVWSNGKPIQRVGKIHCINENEIFLKTNINTERIQLQNIRSAYLEDEFYD